MRRPWCPNGHLRGRCDIRNNEKSQMNHSIKLKVNTIKLFRLHLCGRVLALCCFIMFNNPISWLFILISYYLWVPILLPYSIQRISIMLINYLIMHENIMDKFYINSIKNKQITFWMRINSIFDCSRVLDPYLLSSFITIK